jgi:hypothetical protein
MLRVKRVEKKKKKKDGKKKKLIIIRHCYDFTLCPDVFTKVQVMMLSDPLEPTFS